MSNDEQTWTVEREWAHAGLDCMVARCDWAPRVARTAPHLGTSFRCGYVAVPVWHPYWWHTDTRPSFYLEQQARGHRPKLAWGLHDQAHGQYDPDLSELHCHGGVTHAGELGLDPRDRWWIGFDCNHYGDHEAGERLVEYVAGEVEALADSSPPWPGPTAACSGVGCGN